MQRADAFEQLNAMAHRIGYGEVRAGVKHLLPGAPGVPAHRVIQVGAAPGFERNVLREMARHDAPRQPFLAREGLAFIRIAGQQRMQGFEHHGLRTGFVARGIEQCCARLGQHVENGEAIEHLAGLELGRRRQGAAGRCDIGCGGIGQRVNAQHQRRAIVL